ncbi:DUF2269 family protein [Amycolatopsis suaedae]|uniref:DUF2269 family protein n=1 Tax=Amycolatopsis suaedae TaxID=2510978 RepID=A0A4Q7J6A8_9PSEU|nr:DUF2269 family protein [Amycolatopsis suaedae]RZQ62418.1 DUF2269 family protein [Amycolatopsis suaedae]
MTAFLLSVHVIGAIVLIGPITVAASLFPRYGREALRDGSDGAVVKLLHRISVGYSVAAVAVPVFGVATGAKLGVLTDPWLLVSMALTALAVVLLAVVIVPEQRRILAVITGQAPDDSVTARLKRLSMVTGMFALTWVVVTVLMIVRPGSTTGV